MVRLSDHQNAELHRMAQDEGCSVSDLIRRAVIRHYSLPLDAPNESIDDHNGAPAAAGATAPVKNGQASLPLGPTAAKEPGAEGKARSARSRRRSAA